MKLGAIWIKQELNRKGVGLGLQMVDDLLKANDATLFVVSSKNEGRVFSLLFKF